MAIVLLFLVGVPVLTGIVLYAYLFARSMWRDLSFKHLIILLSLWQQQTGAAFAVGAALIGGIAVWYQTQESDRLEADRRQIRSDALWTTFPLVIANLTKYAERSGKILVDIVGTPVVSVHQRAVQAREALNAASFPQLPTELITQLTDLIEASDARYTQPIRLLIKALHDNEVLEVRRQVLANRSFPDKEDPWILIMDGAIDAAEVYARCEKLLEYVVGRTNPADVEISSGDVVNALANMPNGVARYNMDKTMAALAGRVGQRAEEHKNWPER